MIETTLFLSKVTLWGLKMSAGICIAAFAYLIIFSLLERNSDKSGEGLLGLVGTSFYLAVVFGIVFVVVYSTNYSLVEAKQKEFIEEVIMDGKPYELFEKEQTEKEKAKQDIVILRSKDRVVQLEISNDMNKDQTFEYTLEDIGSMNSQNKKR